MQSRCRWCSSEGVLVEQLVLVSRCVQGTDATTFSDPSWYLNASCQAKTSSAFRLLTLFLVIQRVLGD